MRQLLKYLAKNGIAYYMVVSCMLVGVHPDNRDGSGVLPSQVVELLSGIFALGWDEDEVKAVCTEIGMMQRAASVFNEELVAAANGMLAPIAEQLKFLSLWGSHTNQCLRALKCGQPHPDTSMTKDGKLCLEKVRMHDKPLADACETGVKWLVLPAWLMQKYPRLPVLVQGAGNAAQQIAAGEHLFQVMRKMARHALHLKSIKITPTYEAIKNVVMKTQPSDKKNIAFFTRWQPIMEVETTYQTLYKQKNTSNISRLAHL